SWSGKLPDVASMLFSLLMCAELTGRCVGC
ncbi:MAG: hypothetical protein ACI89G_001700, partial [Minisyncoccia bacterium]